MKCPLSNSKLTNSQRLHFCEQCCTVPIQIVEALTDINRTLPPACYCTEF